MLEIIADIIEGIGKAIIVTLLILFLFNKINMHDKEIENLYTITQQQQELIDMYIKG